MKIAILGGTGEQGPGLALRWATAGETVIIGSRQKEKGEKVAVELNQELGKDLLQGTDNVTAAAEADIAVLTVPYSAHVVTLESVKEQLKGKIFVEVSVPLDPENARRVIMPAAGSASEEAQQVLGPDVQVGVRFRTFLPIYSEIYTQRLTVMCSSVAIKTRDPRS